VPSLRSSAGKFQHIESSDSLSRLNAAGRRKLNPRAPLASPKIKPGKYAYDAQMFVRRFVEVKQDDVAAFLKVKDDSRDGVPLKKPARPETQKFSGD
jgi:hypothetical protein